MDTETALTAIESTFQNSAPHQFVFWAFIAIAGICFIYSQFKSTSKNLWSNIRGKYNDNGMRRQFVYNKQPYLLVLYIALCIVLSICASALILFAVGGIGWLLLWLLKLLVMAVIVVGWICTVVGVIGLFAGGVGCIPLVIGGVILYFEEELEDFGQSCVETGFAFYNELNIWGFCVDIFAQYGTLFGIIAAAPIVIGVGLALIAMLCSFIFWAIEALMTMRYNIKHPCPFCHNPSEPAVYLSENKELPVKLRPGVYGLFHITHPETGEKMPTMLLNGRDSLSRRCPHCNRVISYQTGIEKHIAFVGLPESGKTCLTYRFAGNLMRQYPEAAFTDEVSKEAQRIITDIKNGKEQELASKTSVQDMRRSLQLLVPGKGVLPYHLFINDVGGELFTTSGVESTHVQFFKDVESVFVLIDPLTMDFSGYDLEGDFAEWYKKNAGALNGHKEKVSNVIDTVKSMSHHFTRKTNKIHMNIVLVKIDAGYVPSDIVGDEARIRDFVAGQMNLVAEVADLENTYASLHFYAVSALKNIGIDNMTSGIADQLKIKFD